MTEVFSAPAPVKPARPPEVFLGAEPDGSCEQYLGQITWVYPSQGGALEEGRLTLAGGMDICWFTQTGAVARHGRLFHPETWVVATGYSVGGPVYLTSIREATDAEREDALATVHALRGDSRYQAGAT